MRAMVSESRVPQRHSSGGTHGYVTRHRTGGAAVMAVLAGLLWASQALIWTVGPKVQAVDPPHLVINRPLFVLFWLTIAGAVFCSAAAIGGVLGHLDRSSKLRAVGRIGAMAPCIGSAGAGTAAVLAGVGVAEETCISVLSMTLNAAACALLITVALAAVGIARSHLLLSWEAALPTTLAALTFLTLVAIIASGSQAQAGLIFAVVVVITSGAAWVLLGRALWRLPAKRSSLNR
jgi:hypothetical protein